MSLLEMQNIHKNFGVVKALSGINISLEKGDILGLCGENGAGKSTLMKILSGVYSYQSYEGEIIIDNQIRTFRNIRDAEDAGIGIVHQELNLIPEMSIMENIWLGRYLNNKGFLLKEEMIDKTRSFLLGIAPNLDPETKIKDLGTGERQIVEIVKAISSDVQILILDEPTSSLSEKETRNLLQLIDDLKINGLTAIYISHKLNEIFSICNKVSIIRDGKSVSQGSVANYTENKIIEHMVGRKIDLLDSSKYYPKKEIIFEAKNYTALDRKNSRIKKVNNASFILHRGEILGFSGLIGSGRTELMTCIFGAYQETYVGNSYFKGQEIHIKSPRDALELGIAYVPEERKINGIVLNHSIKHNITMAALEQCSHYGILDYQKEISTAQKSIEELKIKIGALDDLISSLSGGNQQKCMIAKLLMIQPEILILDEPTRGIDIGAKFEIYKYIKKISEQGTSIILVSSELPEILYLSDRVVIMREGYIKASLDNQNLCQEDIMSVAIGGFKNE
ncbi:MAG: sugar ABC transporter ATP-binding protein [Brevinema sp.]